MAEHFIGYVVGETPRALLFQDHFWHVPDWMPKSQIEERRSSMDTSEVHLIAKAWICGQKGIKEFQEVLPKEEPTDANGD